MSARSHVAVGTLFGSAASRSNHPVGGLLEEISERYENLFSWHPGFTPPVTAVPDVFRDYPVRPLSERIPVEGILEAADIGAAANSLEVEPKSWEKWALVSRR